MFFDCMSAFSEQLKTLRKQKGIKQKTLADALGFGSTAIANYESGRNEPSLDTLLKIAAYLEVSTDTLLGQPCASQQNAEPAFDTFLQIYHQLTHTEQELLLHMAQNMLALRQKQT